MTAAVIVQALLIGALLATYGWTRVRPGFLARQPLVSVTVHLTTDQTIAGALAESGRDGLVLRAARFLDSSGETTPLGGELFIPADRINFVQAGV